MSNGIEMTLEESPGTAARKVAQERVDKAIEELAQELAAGKSESLRRFLKFLAKFHNYSFGNCILIAVQRKDATLVAGYRRWQELGRQVRKDERGIGIFAPLTRKVLEMDGSTNQETTKPKLMGFRVVRVFDVSQTDGSPLPEFSRTIGDAAHLIPAMERIIASEKLDLAYETLQWGANGWTDGNTITVRSDLASGEKFRVLVHELAHNQLQHFSLRQDTSKQVRETEAEAVACVVAHAFGIDALGRSSDYIHLWDGSCQTLLQSLNAIQSTAGNIIANLDEELGIPSPCLALAA